MTGLTAACMALLLQTGGAQAVLDTALARMGGREALEGVHQVRQEMLTQWLVTPSFDERPFQDFPSYETHTDERDYTLHAWRNTRHFGVGERARTVVDLVAGGAAVRDFGRGPEPLNVAYVDEWSELYAYTADRFVLEARRAGDLVAGADTVMDGLVHARVEATVEGRRITGFFRRADGLPALVRFREGAPNDFGLVPWGDMQVEVWYSQWRSYTDGLNLPSQIDVRRVGAPYKRMTVLAADFDPEIPVDRFEIDGELRQAFLATQDRPMHDLPLDSARVVEGRFADFRTFGAPAGAVWVDGGWVLLESGQAPLSLERAMDWLAAHPGVRGASGGPGGASVVRAAIVGSRRGNGGAAALVARGVPLWVGRGPAPLVATILRNHDEAGAPFEIVSGEQRIDAGGEEVVVAPLDLPDLPGTVAVYVPSLRWVFSPEVRTRLDRSLLERLIERRGWTVERIGTAAGLVQPLGDAVAGTGGR